MILNNNKVVVRRNQKPSPSGIILVKDRPENSGVVASIDPSFKGVKEGDTVVFNEGSAMSIGFISDEFGEGHVMIDARSITMAFKDI